MPQTAAKTYHDQGAISYTPSSAVTGGDVVVLNGIVGVAVKDIAANVRGSLTTAGVFRLPKTTAAWVRGLPVHWDPAGTPDSGDASSGAANQLGVGTYAGICVEAAGSGDNFGAVDLNAAYPLNSNAAVTATTGGGTTGLIPASATFVTVTSDSADKQISLPAGYVGKVLRILVGTTACELISAVAADKVNEVTVGATNELALTAEALYTCVYTKSGFWIVNGQTKLGAAQAALVPDAL
jgi:predicted RecA/RadA family phage recombinase